jgi:purine-nucleoside phosphorylase
LNQAGRAFRVGGTWTIDTPYRETAAEARHYQDEGILTVEMEAAAVFAVAEHRSVEAAAAFAVSDSLADLAWNPQFDSAETQAGLDAIFEAAVSALSTGDRRVPS